mmetsp:Transcript_6607/g.8808  ORF Transcript_6607/g.8808 Transcript_6607/m.8808 type:complete len:84 (-) Transcript_6607:166-417(-)
MVADNVEFSPTEPLGLKRREPFALRIKVEEVPGDFFPDPDTTIPGFAEDVARAEKEEEERTEGAREEEAEEEAEEEEEEEEEE